MGTFTDRFGRTVTMTSNGVVTFTTSDGLQLTRPAGTTWPMVRETIEAMAPATATLPTARITPLDFLSRFGPKQTAIMAAAQSNPTLLLLVTRASAAQEIDLADPEVRAGLDAIVAAGILTRVEADAILA